MTARDELYAAVMDGGYHSPARSERASARIDAYRAEVLAEAADMVDGAFHGEPFLNYPPDFANFLREMAGKDTGEGVQAPVDGGGAR